MVGGIKFHLTRADLYIYTDIYKASFAVRVRHILAIRQPYGNFHGAYDL